MRITLAQTFALLSTGFLAGAFGYTALNLLPTFHRVPLETRLGFHAELMQNNSVTMQTAMALAASSCVALIFLLPPRRREFAAAAAGAVIAVFLITRFGNVPINQQIKEWATDSAATDHSALTRWDRFHLLRTLAATSAFGLIIAMTLPGSRLSKRFLRPSAPVPPGPA
ncbi:anthrone oxygenase family protein [Nocardia rhamnosiphila]